jgi:hypothetical protein
MDERYAEPVFDVVIALATSLAFTAYMLGLVLDPTPAVIIGLGLVILGATVLIPQEGRMMAGIIGSIAVVVGGAVIPQFMVNFTGFADELSLTVALSGLVLLLTFVTLRITTFSQRTAQPA